ncbi:MAG: peptidoglycan DD-metalloendopeptidase family protein [Gammaproteobacteria bacterium]|jgi:lipoprotein NlpD|nr:peptidase M23 [Chromatiales bacterium]MDP6675565.1 peptidoglycan DD-metalloendopeptidase family protein [Gammaproteobacteria bacterium]
MVLIRYLLPVVACLLIGACSSALRWMPEAHVVQSGETVYSIAFRYGIDQRDLIGWNKLSASGLIFEGQRLRLTAPDSYTAASSASRATGRHKSASSTQRAPTPGKSAAVPVTWKWPVNGAVIAMFGATAKTQSGVHIAGKRGQPVHAAASGEVVYAGSGLPGYGQLLIIKHTSNYLSAYGHNQKLVVGEGDRVKGGQLIAKMGEGPSKRPLLHFEIRRSGKPVNPLRYLPKQ